MERSRTRERSAAALGVAVLLLAAPVSAAPRDVQFKSIDIANQVLEVHNFGTAAADLSGWRFCSHDENQIRVYSSSLALNGVMVGAGESFFIHLANDAPAEPAHMNLGTFAFPLDEGPYGLQVYFPPVNFTVGNQIADHLQWSVDGADDNIADERSDEAQAGGVWVNQSEWISTTFDETVRIELLAGAEDLQPNAPEDYVALPEPKVGLLHLSALVVLAALARARRRASASSRLALESSLRSPPSVGSRRSDSDAQATTLI